MGIHLVPFVKDKNGKSIYLKDNVVVSLPGSYKDRAYFKGKIIYNDGEYRVGNLEDEYGQAYKDWPPDNYVRLCDLYEIFDYQYISNYGNVPKTKSKYLNYLEVVKNER